MDLSHYWGGDLSVSPSGDFATVDGQELGVQRIVRRLMTAPGELVYHPKYGGGAASEGGAGQGRPGHHGHRHVPDI